MKFTFIKKVEGKVSSYDGYKVKTGDVIDLGGNFAKKATANPDYEAVIEPVTPKPQKQTPPTKPAKPAKPAKTATPEKPVEVKPAATTEAKADGNATAAKK